MKKLYVNETRGGIVEAKHKIHVTAFQGNNQILSIGEPNMIVPMRSVAKPFMLCPLMEDAGKSNIMLTPAMLSIMTSSHNGEKTHRKLVKHILSLSDSSVSNLHCGSHLPYYSWLYDEFFSEKNYESRQLFHNCSGKHAGMLLLASLMSVPKEEYWSTDHPVQRRIAKSVRTILEVGREEVFTLALDGCGVPTYCVKLKTIAKGFQSLYRQNALIPVFQAILAEPFFNSGTDRIEMKIINECGSLAKTGSSGLFCLADKEDDIGIALKVEDGNDEISEAAIVEVMAYLGLLDNDAKERLKQYRELDILTSTGLYAGKYEPIWEDK